MYGKEMWDRKHELCCEMAKREESERWEKKVAFDEMSFSGERGAEVEQALLSTQLHHTYMLAYFTTVFLRHSAGSDESHSDLKSRPPR